jgi:hypothetical protein
VGDISEIFCGACAEPMEQTGKRLSEATRNSAAPRLHHLQGTRRPTVGPARRLRRSAGPTDVGLRQSDEAVTEHVVKERCLVGGLGVMQRERQADLRYRLVSSKLPPPCSSIQSELTPSTGPERPACHTTGMHVSVRAADMTMRRSGPRLPT